MRVAIDECPFVSEYERLYWFSRNGRWTRRANRALLGARPRRRYFSRKTYRKNRCASPERDPKTEETSPGAFDVWSAPARRRPKNVKPKRQTDPHPLLPVRSSFCDCPFMGFPGENAAFPSKSKSRSKTSRGLGRFGFRSMRRVPLASTSRGIAANVQKVAYLWRRGGDEGARPKRKTQLLKIFCLMAGG